MRLRIITRGEPIEVEVALDGEGRIVSLGDRSWRVSTIARSGAAGAVLVDGRPVRYLATRAGERLRVAVFGECFEFDLSGRLGSGRAATMTASPETRAPMPGKVLKVETEVGARVEPGAPLLILEAMKMETILAAEVAGTITEVNVTPGEMVDPGKVLVRIAVETAEE